MDGPESVWGGAVRSAGQSVDAFAELPDPGRARDLDDLVERLRLLKVWAGDPSYEQITGRVNAAWTAAGRPAAELVGKTTVVSCFLACRRRGYPLPLAGFGRPARPGRGAVG